MSTPSRYEAPVMTIAHLFTPTRLEAVEKNGSVIDFLIQNSISELERFNIDIEDLKEHLKTQQFPYNLVYKKVRFYIRLLVD